MALIREHFGSQTLILTAVMTTSMAACSAVHLLHGTVIGGGAISVLQLHGAVSTLSAFSSVQENGEWVVKIALRSATDVEIAKTLTRRLSERAFDAPPVSLWAEAISTSHLLPVPQLPTKFSCEQKNRIDDFLGSPSPSLFHSSFSFFSSSHHYHYYCCCFNYCNCH